MTNESMSTQHINLAERFPSFAEYPASTASLPQTAATSLDIARFHAFTGELAFSVDPEVRLYLDGGNVYHAERHGDRPVSHVLLDAGVIDSTQLQRGIVSVGAVEHLGRLFDRDTTVDRDAVMVVIESATDSLLQQIANSVIASITVTAYRHHPSGIHRWFVAPAEPTGVQRPSSGVMQFDRSVVEELPRLDGGPTGQSDGANPLAAPLTIDWAESDPSSPGRTEHAGDSPKTAADIDIEAELDRFDADRADWSAAPVGSAPQPSDEASSPLGEFRIVWPNGSKDDSLVESPAPAEPVVDQPAAIIDNTVAMPAAPLAPPPPPAVVTPAPVPAPVLAAPVSAPAPAPSAPTPVAADPDPLGFTMKPLQIDQLPEPDTAVPDDVANAVRRALQAIENATAAPMTTSVAALHLAPVALPELSTPAPPPAPVAPQPLGFAPPTMATSAEAVYERAVSEAVVPDSAVIETSLSAVMPAQSEIGPASAPVEQNAAEDRRGALQRLIGSLRIKD